MTTNIEPISLETALIIHRRKIEDYGGAHGVREEGILDACLAQPWQSFGGQDLYPTLEEKAARLGYEIIAQHPFVDGNKRTGAALMTVLLRANGVRFKPKSKSFITTIINVASGALGYKDLVQFIRDNS